MRIAKRTHYTVVAVHLHRQAQAVQLPPQGEIPWKEADEDRSDAKEKGIMRRSMFFLMPNDVFALRSWQSEHPPRHYHSRVPHADCCGSNRIGDECLDSIYYG